MKINEELTMSDEERKRRLHAYDKEFSHMMGKEFTMETKMVEIAKVYHKISSAGIKIHAHSIMSPQVAYGARIGTLMGVMYKEMAQCLEVTMELKLIAGDEEVRTYLANMGYVIEVVLGDFLKSTGSKVDEGWEPKDVEFGDIKDELEKLFDEIKSKGKHTNKIGFC